MPKAPITRFSNLVIDTELDPGNEYKIMRCPRLSQKEIDEIPEDGLKGGEIIFNIENDSFQFYDGTSWIASEGTGTVTEINTGTGLTGGPITSTGTIDLTNTGVTSGAYTYANVTVDEQGRVTSISSNPDPEGTGTVTEINTGTGLTGGPITSTGTIDLTNTGVTSGTYTYADVTVDEQGRVTSISSNPDPEGTGTVTEINTGTGLTGGPITETGTIDLTNTGVTSGTYTYADVTVDEQGRVTSISSNPDPEGTGTVTEINTGTGLTGGPITETGTIDLTNTGVTSGAYTYADVTVDEQGRVTNIASNPTPTTGTVTEINTGTGLTGGPITETGTIDLTNTGVTSGAYTYADVTVDEQGRVTNIASNPTPTTGTVTEINTGTGLTGGPITETGTIDLTNTGVTSGAYTYANVTVDEQGRVTSISSNPDPEGTGTVTEINTGTGLTGGPITSTGTIDLTNTGVTSGTYTYADVTVDEQGRVTSISSNPDPEGTGTVTEINTGTGLTGGPITETGTIDLTNTGVTSGTYTYADVTVDEQGRVTSISSNPDPEGTGTVTEINTGTGLTGGPITETGTIDLTNTGVTSGAYTYADVTVDEQGRVTNIASNPTPTTGTVTEINTGTGLTGGPITETGTIDLTNTGVTSGAYTYADVTVDEQGRVTNIASNPTPTTGTVTEINTGTGLTGGPITETGTIDLTNTGVTSGAYTYANVTVDEQGRVTSISSNPDPEGTGTVTEINTGTGLTGGPITETGTIDLTNTGVTSGAYTYANVTVDEQGRVTSISSDTGIGSYSIYRLSGTTSDHLSNGDHCPFNSDFSSHDPLGLITLSTTTYTTSVGVHCLGRVKLKSGYIYKINGFATSQGNTAYYGFSLYDVTSNNTRFGTYAGGHASSDPDNNADAILSTGYVKATQDRIIELRKTGGTLASWYNGNNNLSECWMEIQVIRKI